jgi:hypothetical protein
MEARNRKYLVTTADTPQELLDDIQEFWEPKGWMVKWDTLQQKQPVNSFKIPGVWMVVLIRKMDGEL